MTNAKTNIVPFGRPATDGSNTDGTEDWLREFEFEDRFLCSKKASNSYAFDAYGVALVLPEAILLAGLDDNTPLTKFEWVDSKKFSKLHNLVCMLPKTERGETSHDDDLPLGPPDSDHYE
jgi:hypothetical protein